MFDPATRTPAATVSLSDATADTLVDYAIMLARGGERDAARAIILKAIGQEPTNARAHVALAEFLLAGGEFRAGFIEYEWRTALDEVHLPTDKPVWTGCRLGGGDLVVIADQGFGDNIMFARYLETARRRCRQLHLGIDPSMASLMRYALPHIAIFSHWSEAPPFAAFCRLSSLPYALGAENQDLPFEHSRALSSDYHPGFSRIGICESGRIDAPHRATRALPPGRLRLLCDRVPGVECTELAFARMDPQPADWLATAALIARLDLVITVDTAIAHLAASMGVRTWVLLKSDADWRWGLGDQSVWYPSARLFRQTSPGEWDEPLDGVEFALRCLVD